MLLFQHYGWDGFSRERWDPPRQVFDEEGTGAAHWWTDQDRAAMLDVVSDYNVVGIFHGHEHDRALVYQVDGIDVFKPKAAYKGGFAVVHVTDQTMDVAVGEAVGDTGGARFTHAFNKPIGSRLKSPPERH